MSNIAALIRSRPEHRPILEAAAQLSQGPAAGGDAMTGPEDKHPTSILMAEDDPVSRRVLESFLIKWNFELVVVADGGGFLVVTCGPTCRTADNLASE